VVRGCDRIVPIDIYVARLPADRGKHCFTACWLLQKKIRRTGKPSNAKGFGMDDGQARTLLGQTIV